LRAVRCGAGASSGNSRPHISSAGLFRPVEKETDKVRKPRRNVRRGTDRSLRSVGVGHFAYVAYGLVMFGRCSSSICA